MELKTEIFNLIKTYGDANAASEAITTLVEAQSDHRAQLVRNEQVRIDCARLKSMLDGTGASVDAVIANPSCDPLAIQLAKAIKEATAEMTKKRKNGKRPL